MMHCEEILQFVKEHRGEDPARLRLKYHGDPRPWLPSAIYNIAALKNRRKFILRDGADLTPDIIPLEIPAQQSTSANIALLHANLAGNARSVLDMTFGLGMDARLMAMDPQRRILGFDLQPELAEAAAYNFRNFPNVEVRCGDSVEYLRSSGNFDLIFVDPARRGDAGRRLFNLHDCQPDLIEILPLLRSHGKLTMAKLSPMLDVTQTLRDLPGISDLHIVEESGECKELLAIIGPSLSVGSSTSAGSSTSVETPEPLIVIDRLTPEGLQQFSFTQSEERSVDNSVTLLGRIPRAGEYLHEPSAATMKAAPFGLLATRFPCKTLAPNSHIYISDSEIPGFPGNGYRIEAAFPLTSSNIKRITRNVKQADVAVRNLKGFTADGLAKKMRLKPGGSKRILGTTVETPTGPCPLLLILEKFIILNS